VERSILPRFHYNVFFEFPGTIFFFLSLSQHSTLPFWSRHRRRRRRPRPRRRSSSLPCPLSPILEVSVTFSSSFSLLLFLRRPLAETQRRCFHSKRVLVRSKGCSKQKNLTGSASLAQEKTFRARSPRGAPEKGDIKKVFIRLLLLRSLSLTLTRVTRPYGCEGNLLSQKRRRLKKKGRKMRRG